MTDEEQLALKQVVKDALDVQGKFLDNYRQHVIEVHRKYAAMIASTNKVSDVLKRQDETIEELKIMVNDLSDQVAALNKIIADINTNEVVEEL